MTPDGDGDRNPQEWDADAYDGDHAFVYEYGADLLGILDPQPGERILDLGCGTGHLTAEIADSGVEVVGMDRDAGMLTEAREAHPKLQFVRADAREFAASEPFDAVFSNAALHWIDDEGQDAALASVAEALTPGGRFVAELGGRGNVATIVEALQAAAAERGYEVESPWYFPSVGEYATRLESHGLETQYARLFDRPTELEDGEAGLRNWLSMFGDGLLAAVPEADRSAVIADVEDRLREELFADSTWIADYRRLRVRAVRTGGAERTS